MSLLQESVDALTAAAGWKKASPGADGVFRFRLEGDLDMEFFRLMGGRASWRADLGPLPAAEQDADDLLRKCASRMGTRPRAPGGRSFRWMRAGFRCTLLCLWPRALPPCRGMPRIF